MSVQRDEHSGEAIQVNVPIALTLSRLAAAPILLAAMNLRSTAADAAAILLFAYALASDVLDGRLARARGETSALGSLLDPLADSILFISLFAGFVDAGWMPLWLFCLVPYREVLMHGVLRPHLLSSGIVLAARRGGKLKTVAQAAIGMFVLCSIAAVRAWPAEFEPMQDGLKKTAYWLLLLAVLVSLGSMYKYLLDVWPRPARAPLKTGSEMPS
jgi:CDP-diacylglycerol--glycerol-3-phosphate 3-phosphatidyltransferase